VPTRRDALIVGLTAIAVVASVSSSPGTLASDKLRDVELTETTTIFDITVRIEGQRLESAFEPLTTGLSVGIEIEPDEASVAAIEGVSSRLFAVGDNTSSLVSSSDEAVFEDNVGRLIAFHRHDVRIDDCTSAPCRRNFELELTVNSSAPVVALADLFANVGNKVSEDVGVGVSVRETE
jgi:hypothetical protein